MQPIIRLIDIKKSYYIGAQSTKVLHDIDFELAAGEMAAIVGMSGSGKSTLMNIIGLLDQATSGRYFLNGKDVSQLSPNAAATIRNQHIGFVFQSFFLLPRLSAVENVMLPLHYRRMTYREAKQQALAILAQVGLSELSSHKPMQLSGGQQQRVAIARALVANPKLILADEPTGALDSKTSQDVMALLKNLNQEHGKTILLITHDFQVSQQANKTFVMQDGLLVCDESKYLDPTRSEHAESVSMGRSTFIE